MNGLIGKTLQYKLMHGQKGLLRKGRCSEPILVGNHYQDEIKLCRNLAQVLKHIRVKLEFRKRVQLVSWRRFFYDNPIPVDKEYSCRLFFCNIATGRYYLLN